MKTLILLYLFLSAPPNAPTPIGAITPTSKVAGIGTPVGAPDTDYCGNPRPAGHPSIGAFDINSGPNCENLSIPNPNLDPPTIIDNP